MYFKVFLECLCVPYVRVLYVLLGITINEGINRQINTIVYFSRTATTFVDFMFIHAELPWASPVVVTDSI